MLPIWKIMGVLIADGNDKLGVIEVSKRAQYESDAGRDFTIKDLQYLESSMKNLAPVLKKVFPQNFRGKLS